MPNPAQSGSGEFSELSQVSISSSALTIPTRFLPCALAANKAAATGLAFFGVAGEAAGDGAPGPGTFMIRLLDTLHTLTPDELAARCRIREA